MKGGKWFGGNLYQFYKSIVMMTDNSEAFVQRGYQCWNAEIPSSQRLDPAEEQHLPLSSCDTFLLLLDKALLQVLTPTFRPLVPCNSPCHRPPTFSFSRKPRPPSAQTERSAHKACLALNASFQKELLTPFHLLWQLYTCISRIWAIFVSITLCHPLPLPWQPFSNKPHSTPSPNFHFF